MASVHDRYHYTLGESVLLQMVFYCHRRKAIHCNHQWTLPFRSIPSSIIAKTEKNNLVLLPWARKAKLDSRTIETSLIDLKMLKRKLPEIRSMTTMDPVDFCPKLRDMFANCGIALVFLPHIGGSFLHGVTFYDKNKIVVGLTVCGKDADKFWFSLFHELGHILLGHINQPNGTTEKDEADADNFAKEVLIPTVEFNAFTSKNDFTKASIITFAQKQNILCGIVIGRLQKEGYINYNRCNDLKTKYSFSA